jgi:putative transposase
MPWQEVVTVELRQQFIQDALLGVVPIAELCAGYGISRKTGYKFLARYRAFGVSGLDDRSRRPLLPASGAGHRTAPGPPSRNGRPAHHL